MGLDLIGPIRLVGNSHEISISWWLPIMQQNAWKIRLNQHCYS